MPSRRAALLVLALTVVAGAAGWWWRQRASSGAGDEQIRAAHALAPTLTKPLALDPLGLVARGTPDLRCSVEPQDVAAQCQGAAGEIGWHLQVEATPGPVAARVSARRREFHRDDAEELGGDGEWLGEHTLAGFTGWVEVIHHFRMPVTHCAFTGWRDEPGVGQVRLVVQASPADRRPAALLAVMLTTSAAAQPPEAWIWRPTEERRHWWQVVLLRRELERDGAEPDAWREAASRLAGFDQERAEPRRTVTPLVERRARELAQRDDPARFQDAVVMALSLRDWDRARGDALLGALADQARRRSRDDGGTRWMAARIRLGWAWWRRQESRALLEVAADLEAADPVALAREVSRPLGLLLEARSLAPVRALLERWFTGPLARLPDDGPFGSLTELCQDDRDPLVHGLALRLLDRRTPYGSIVVREASTEVRTPQGGTLKLGASPGARSGEAPLRVADHCAHHLADEAGAPAFALTDPVGVRDRAIAAQRAWLRRPR